MTDVFHTIPTNFHIPKQMADHCWVFMAGPNRTAIRPKGPNLLEMRNWLVDPQFEHSNHGLTNDQILHLPDTLKMIQSRELDWLHESVEHLRSLCGKNMT